MFYLAKLSLYFKKLYGAKLAKSSVNLKKLTFVYIREKTYLDRRGLNGLQVLYCALTDGRVDVLQGANEETEDVGERRLDRLVVHHAITLHRPSQHRRLLNCCNTIDLLFLTGFIQNLSFIMPYNAI